MLELEAFELKEPNRKFNISIITCSKRIIKNMDDHLFCSRRRHVLDSGLADLETD
jgi:hypothetical protein